MASKIRTYVDPACPWAWVTTNWLFKQVEPNRDLDITIRPFSLAILNKDNKDLDDEKREKFAATLKILRLFMAVEHEYFNKKFADFYFALGKLIHNPVESNRIHPKDIDFAEMLSRHGMAVELASQVDNTDWDEKIRESIEEARTAAGGDIGTPIISKFRDDGEWVAFFGPVLSSMPKHDMALDLWDGLDKLTNVKGFFELKRNRDLDLNLASVL